MFTNVIVNKQKISITVDIYQQNTVKKFTNKRKLLK